MNRYAPTRAASLLALACLAGPAAHAQPADARADDALQSPDSIAAAAESYLRTQLRHLPGQARIATEPLRQSLPACDSLQAFLPTGAKPRPRMSIGVRCSAPQAWSTYVQANVAVPGTYYVAARALPIGQVIGVEHLQPRSGDLLRLPPGAVVSLDDAIGRSTSQRVATGQPLRQATLRHAQAVQRGHTVKVMARGAGFMVAGEGQAMDNGAPGTTISVRTRNGQIVSGVVQDSGAVEVQL